MIKALVICDDLWHPGEVIVKGLESFPASEVRFDIVMDAKDILTRELLEEYSVIINCKCNSITAANTHPWFEAGVTEVMPEDFEDYVRRGGGFLSVHSGNAFYRENDCWPYIEFVGNYFVQHPPRCPVRVIPTGEHPITEGIDPFTVRDEHYEIRVIAEDAEQILCTESEAGGRQTGGYVRKIGQGRLCVLTPGHILSVWQNESYQRLF